MTTLIARGALGKIPAGTWVRGRTKRAFLDVGSQRLDGCWVPDYLEDSLIDCVGEEVELSFCRLDKKDGPYLCAIRHKDGRVERLPTSNDGLFGQMLVAGVIWGVITFLTTWLAIPVMIIPIWLLSKTGIDSETILGSVAFGGLFFCWMGQMMWVLFYSKRLSPKVRLQAMKTACGAFD